MKLLKYFQIYMYYTTTMGEAIVGSFQTMWMGVIGFLPNLVAALIVFIFGWIIALGIGRLVVKGVRMTRVDTLLERMGLREPVEKAGYKLDAGKFLGEMVRWFIIGVFLLSVADILRLQEVSVFLRDVVYYIPNIIIAAVIMLVAVILANFLSRLIKASVHLGGFVSGKFLSALAKWATLVFGFLTALLQLGVAASLINTFITGFVAMIAIAGGIAFGLGGKDQASMLLEKLRREVTENHHHEG